MHLVSDARNSISYRYSFLHRHGDPTRAENNIMKNEGSHKVSVIHKAIYAESVRLYFILLFCAPNQPATATLYDSAIPAMVSRHGNGSRKLKIINGVKTDGFIELKDM